ncbi:Sterol uptake control protein 2 [Apiospora kogelbergensis]|uniref:Sterol uptake control protein 2 n=1 Tax=Apiospora kogelbergensis TaxID=1337665 RepID=UPI0031326381
MTDPKPRGVASRRHHPKTRTGCSNCKSRKVKCDERTPACGNCIKHNVVCGFLSSTKGLPVSVPTQPQGLHMQDLELLHNYTTRTYATLSDSLILRDFYRTTAVQYGLENEYIMRTLLSVSASHMAYHRPEMQRHYQALAMSHHQIATKSAMDLMANPTPSQAEGLFLFSVLTIIFALGCPRRDDKFLLVGESGFPNWMFLLQGTKALTSVIAGAQKDTILAPLLNDGADRWLARAAGHLDRPDSKVNQRLDSINDLIQLRQPDEELRGTYAHAIEELKKSFSSSRPTQAAGVVSRMLFLSKAGSSWCLHGWAGHLIDKCYMLLDEEHRVWIQWPLEEMGWVR